MPSNKTFSRLFFAGAAAVALSVNVDAQEETRQGVVAPGVNCSDGNRQMCEKIITQTGEVYKYYI